MRSSELQEALKRARMKTETKNDQPKNPTKKEDERSRSSETGGSHNKNDRDSSPTVQKTPKKQTKAKAPLNLDSGKTFYSICEMKIEAAK